jgi:hypothetical protein
MKTPNIPPSLLPIDRRQLAPRQYADTDPHMLFALWDSADNADARLDELEGAVVVYDKFRPRLSSRLFRKN